ncbi:hypothetical protein ECP02989423_3485 [Escherichia coli P0298942.3]|nr:hypothetical protein ECP02989423_3485 [Escherichia coli P0298942.3]
MAVPTKYKNYAASAAWKAAALNILKHLTVNRRSPASAGNTLTGCSVPLQPCQTLFVSGESQDCIKGPEDKSKTEYLSPFFSSVYFPR